MSRRSSRAPTLSSPLALLDHGAALHHAITREMAGLQISGAHYQALARASDALHRLAKDLGHEGRYVVPGHSTPGPTGR